MSMFFGGGRQQQNNPNDALRQHAQNVEDILQSINVNPSEARMQTQEGYGWSFQQGSAIIEIYLARQQERDYFQVLAPILHVPPGNLLPLYRRLLELNLSLTNASLGIYQDVIYVFNERPIDGLDGTEANFIIKQISGYADDLDDSLMNEFGGRLYSQV